GVTPIISPIAIGEDGLRYNVNADTAAGAVASALLARQLIFVTDVPGILKDGELQEEVTTIDIEAYIEDGTILGGMIQKVKAAMRGLKNQLEEGMTRNGKETQLKDKRTSVGTTIKVAATSKS